MINNQNNQNDQETRFTQFIKQHELSKKVAQDLKTVLETCIVVLLCDDSSSMVNAITEEENDPFNQKKTTRWMELKKLAAALIDVITVTNPNGMDLYFLNRATQRNVSTPIGLSGIFSIDPNGGTDLTKKLNQIYNDKKDLLVGNKQLLIIVITDGEPVDGTSNPRNNLYRAITNITNNGNVHVSFAECTDQEEDMKYLDEWDNKIKNFDNTDDYREELRRVKATNGQSFKFDYTDYVIKILLATFIKSYFNIDQGSNNIQRSDNRQNNDDCNCCTIL